MQKKQYNKVIIIHPGTQHAYRLANAIALVSPLKEVKLYTWFIISSSSILGRIHFLKHRIRKIDKSVSIRNYPFFELLLIVHKKINRFFNLSRNNNPYYFWQTIFGFFLIPLIYIKREKTILIVFESCGWPITKYAKKWGIPVIMDFSAISHESASLLGIKETKYGIKIKKLERQNIDYGFNCSNFAVNTYKGKTSAKQHYSIWLGTDFQITSSKAFSIANEKVFNCCCIGNSEFIKGIDILLEAFSQINHNNKKLYIIGQIDKNWITNYCNQKNISLNNVILSGKIEHKHLKIFLMQHNIHLHILPSRFDSFGMVVPETMALGIPNIISPNVGAGEMIDDQINGLKMKILDVNELILQINNYLQMTAAEKSTLAENTLKKSQEMTWEMYNERIKTALTAILSSH